MSSEKKLEANPHTVQAGERAEVIAQALEELPDLSRTEMGALVTKMNHAAMIGSVRLTSTEAHSLRILSQKFIPDAPKEIRLEATVKTEDVIIGYLRDSDRFLEDAKVQASSLEGAQEANYKLLTDFKETF